MRFVILWLPTVCVCAIFLMLMKQPPPVEKTQQVITSDRELIRQLEVDSQHISERLEEVEARSHHVTPRGGLN